MVGATMAVVEQPFLVGPRSFELRALVERSTTDEDAARRLMARVLLHTPRLADAQGHLAPEDALREVERLAAQELAAADWFSPPPRVPASPTELVPAELVDGRPRFLHERFHYLRSYRQGRHIAGLVEGRVAVLLTFSPLDLDALRMTLPPGLKGAEALVLSRVYATAWAPRNSLSRMLACAARLLRASDPRPRLLLTYLNPGIGFDGASYKAANWRLFGREHGTRYAYLDQSYVTDRELTARFGTSHGPALAHLLGPRIAFSSMPLQPLQMYALALDGRLRRELSNMPPRDWSRPWA
jgi:hypothetical protein